MDAEATKLVENLRAGIQDCLTSHDHRRSDAHLIECRMWNHLAALTLYLDDVHTVKALVRKEKEK